MTTEVQGAASLPEVPFRAVGGVRICYADSGGSRDFLVGLTAEADLAPARVS